MGKWKFLYWFVLLINFWLSRIGWRLLHCNISLAIGYTKFNFSQRLISFVIVYWLVLELFCNKFIFNPEIYFDLGEEILKDIKREIEREKKKD